MPGWLRPLILALAAVAISGWLSRPFVDTDSWWHLKTGQYIVENHKLPVPDPFSYTAERAKEAYPGEARVRNFNLTHEWLAQALFYAVYRAAGFGGVVLLRVLLLGGCCVLVALAARRRGCGFHGAVVAALAAASVLQFQCADRPQEITFLLLALTVYLLETGRFLWALPPVFLFWANAHGGFVVGWVAIGGYCAEALFLRWRGRPVADERRLWAVAAASVAVAVLNPNGLRIFQVLLDYRRSPLQNTLIEWRRTQYWEISPFTALFYSTILTLLWARGKARFADWLLFTVYAVAALSAVRNIFLVALAGPPILVGYFPWKPARRIPRAAGEFAFAGLLAILAVWVCASPRSFQFRADESARPKGAADFLLAHRVTAPLLNTYNEGGYLIWKLWPQERVFTDGRALSEAAFEDGMRMQANADATGGRSAEQLLADYGIEVILTNGFEFTSGTVYYLPAALSDPSQKEWKLVYRDAVAMVFMRHPPPGVEPLNPLDALASMEDQCAAHIHAVPGENGCAREMGKLFSLIGDAGRARKWSAVYEGGGL